MMFSNDTLLTQSKLHWRILNVLSQNTDQPIFECGSLEEDGDRFRAGCSKSFNMVPLLVSKREKVEIEPQVVEEVNIWRLFSPEVAPIIHNCIKTSEKGAAMAKKKQDLEAFEQV